MVADLKISYRHRLVDPELPPPSSLEPFLEEMRANGWYTNFGPLVRRLETGLLASFGAAGETCVTCSNATAGLSAALLAAGRPGPVLIPAFTFPASLGAVRAAGMTPIVIDVNAQSWTLAREMLDEAIAATGAGAVMLVAPFGIAHDWAEELAICRKRGVAVVIDNASGLGGPRPGASYGKDVFEVFSMHATKPFAVGEGGMILAHHTQDAALRSALNFALTSQGADDLPAWGFNGKMSELHAAVGLAQLAQFDQVIVCRQAFASAYQGELARYSGLVYPHDPRCAPWQFFPVLLPGAAAAEQFIAAAAEAGVEIRRYYRPSLSRWRDTPNWRPCPVAEDLAERMCMLPVRARSADRGAILDLVMSALRRTHLAAE